MTKSEKTMTLEEKWNSLTLANNFIFCKVMESNPDLCKHLLEILLHIEIDHLEPPQTESTMQEELDSKSVRFDVYTKDFSRIFDLEMQTIKKENLLGEGLPVYSFENICTGNNDIKLNDRKPMTNSHAN